MAAGARLRVDDLAAIRVADDDGSPEAFGALGSARARRDEGEDRADTPRKRQAGTTISLVRLDTAAA